MKMAVFWDALPCSLLEIYRRFRGASTSETSIRLHGAKSQKTAIFSSCSPQSDMKHFQLLLLKATAEP
jgi:hypothetical protein